MKKIVDGREIIDLETRINNLKVNYANNELEIRTNENNIAKLNKSIEELARKNDALLKNSIEMNASIKAYNSIKEQEDFLKEREKDNNSEKKTEAKEEKSSELEEEKKPEIKEVKK